MSKLKDRLRNKFKAQKKEEEEQKKKEEEEAKANKKFEFQVVEVSDSDESHSSDSESEAERKREARQQKKEEKEKKEKEAEEELRKQKEKEMEANLDPLTFLEEEEKKEKEEKERKEREKREKEERQRLEKERKAKEAEAAKKNPLLKNLKIKPKQIEKPKEEKEESPKNEDDKSDILNEILALVSKDEGDEPSFESDEEQDEINRKKLEKRMKAARAHNATISQISEEDLAKKQELFKNAFKTKLRNFAFRHQKIETKGLTTSIKEKIKELAAYNQMEGYEKIHDIIKQYRFNGFIFEDDQDVTKIYDEYENKYVTIQPVKYDLVEIMKNK